MIDVKMLFSSSATAAEPVPVVQDDSMSTPMSTPVRAVASRAIDTLFAVANPKFDPEGLITKYVQYESFRLTRDHYLDDMTGSFQDRFKVLMWYLNDYIGHRRGAYEVPLSARQIAFLNGPMPIPGAPTAVTVAFWNFVNRGLPSHTRYDDTRIFQEALYWWCIERAPASKLEHSLVTKEQIAILATDDQWLGDEYPLNPFMAIFARNNKEFSDLKMSDPRDRAALFHYMTLLSYKNPYILKFLSRDSLRRVLRSGGARTTPFDHVIARYAFPDGTPASAGTKLRWRGEALQKALTAMRDAGTGNAGECHLRRRDLSAPVEQGVALVGPIVQTSGLGQATRLSYDILTAAETVPPTALLSAIDNPAPVGFATAATIRPYRNRRAINLIHLNAESVPLAFAFEQKEVFCESYNIGYFFWELNKIPKCHTLALETLDEIWVSSEYNREIYASYTDKPVVNVGMAVENLPDVTPLSREDLGLDPDATIFLAAFDSFSYIERKNPIGAVEAFRLAFPLGTEKVQLVLKTQNRTRVADPYQIAVWRKIERLASTDPRIVIIDETMKYRDVLALKLTCDCYLSLHRSEGWGFGMIEAMQLGRPVISTAYSGNMDFCTPDNGFLVGYDLIGVRTEEYIFVERGSVWADPKREEAAAAMCRVADDPAEARARGQAGAAHIRAHFTVDAIAKRYRARLSEIRAAALA